MPKKSKGLGAYTTDEDPIVRREDNNSWKTTDRSRTVDSNHKVNNGFSGPLSPAKE